MSIKSINVLSKVALATAFASSVIVPTVVVSAETKLTYSLDGFLLELEGKVYEIPLDYYNDAVSAGIQFIAEVSHITSEGKHYKLEDYNDALVATDGISSKAIQLLYEGSLQVESLSVGTVEIDGNGNVSYIDSNTTKENETKRYFIN